MRLFEKETYQRTLIEVIGFSQQDVLLTSNDLPGGEDDELDVRS